MPRTLRYLSRQVRPLVNRSAVSGLAVVTLLGWCGLLWLASERQELAARVLPSALSLRLLELGLSTRPRDDGLRMQLARKRLEAGQLVEARELVQQALDNPVFRAEAEELLIEIDYARWSAVDPHDRTQRAARLAELRRTLDAATDRGSSQALLLRVAALHRETEQPAKAAAILDNLARAVQPVDAARFEAADAAWLEAGQPLAAADLLAFLAAQRGPDGPKYAALALERAQLSGNADALSALLSRMRALYPQDVSLLRRAVALTEASDVRRACDLALELARLSPASSEYHREAARLAEASGRSLCALDQYVWLWRHEHRAEDKLHALRLARENWDLDLVRELLDGPRPSQTHARSVRRRKGCSPRARQLLAAEWEDRFRLYEALGDTSAARGLLARVVKTPEGDSLFWWRRKLELEKRLDDHTAAQHTLTQMLQRFPERGVREELADLQLSTGQASAALATLLAAPGAQRDNLLLRRIVALAADVDNIAAERAGLEDLTRLPDATLWDYQRLLTLAPDLVSAAQIADEACSRYQSYDMFYTALQLYGRAGREAAQHELLERVAALEQIARRVDYWQIRINVEHTRAARAVSDRNYPVAKAALEHADGLLRYAAKQAPPKDQYAVLWGAQHAQALSVGIASGDTAFALRAFLATKATLSVRERVYLLIKLGQVDQALQEARRELEREQLRDSDRSVLENDALSLSRGRATDLQILGHGFIMAGLQAFGSSARIEYAEIAGGLRASVDFTEFQAVIGESLLHAPVRDMTAAARGRLGRFALELGATVRDAEQVRPFGSLQARIAGDDERGASVQALANVVSADTSRLRVFGAADALALKAVVGLGKYFWASGRASGEMYYTRNERRYLGWGATVDAGIGATVQLPHDIGNAGLRLFGRGAPRFASAAEPEDVAPDIWLPATSLWTGLAVSLSRGQLDAPLLFGKQISYALDASVGFLWPASSTGWSVTGQLGVSVLGADNLSLAATAGNVLGANGFSGSVGYVVSFVD